MNLPPGGDDPPEVSFEIDEPPIDPVMDTRPLKPLYPKPKSVDKQPPAATVLQEARPGVDRKALSNIGGDTNQVRLVPKLPSLPYWRVIFLVGTAPPPTTLGLDVRQELVMGRADADDQPSPGLDLTPYLAADQGVSRLHAVLIPMNEGLCIADLGSKNGTWINGQFLDPGRRHQLVPGDRVELGLLRLVVRSITLQTRNQGREG
ncbi:MAG: FHA domain-containing protein [Anaerolineae bacterium]|nr:FHA domain-containing protein [Anaerolineae bacterium]